MAGPCQCREPVECGNCAERCGPLKDIGLRPCCRCDESTSCFPSDARLSLENGKSITMVELKRGDRVKTGKVNIVYSVSDPGGQGRHPEPVKISHKKLGHCVQRFTFHVSWPPSPKFHEPAIVITKHIEVYRNELFSFQSFSC